MSIELFRGMNFALATGLRLAGILLLAIGLTHVLRLLTRRLVKMATSESRVARMREQQTRTLAGVLQSAGTVLILAVALLMALPLFGINVTPLAALAGLASVALGFGAQNLIRDLINGFFVVFEDQFVVGDTIRAGNTTGRVEHVTLRRTVLRDARGAVVTIPNGEMREVANLSRDWSQVFLDLEFDSEQPLDAALRTLERTCGEFRADPVWSAALVDGPRVLGVEAMTLNGVTVRLQVRTAPNRNEEAARELRRRVLAACSLDEIALSRAHRVRLVGTAREV